MNKPALALIPLYGLAYVIMGFQVVAAIFSVHVILIPFLFKYCKALPRSIVFCNFFQWPFHTDFENPSKSGVKGGRNIPIKYESKVDNCTIQIGVWHILPRSVYETHHAELDSGDEDTINTLMDDLLANSKHPVILYCHGNSNSRAASHRLELYKLFTSLDYHVIAFDYRGYGDSTNLRPTENGVVEDSLIVYDWLKSIVDKGTQGTHSADIFVWGHSLGTAISSHLLGNLSSLSCMYLNKSEGLASPKGLILESPFNNFHDEIENHPLVKLVSWLPYFKSTIVQSFDESTDFDFKSDEHLSKAKALPVLILHAEDDLVVPHELGVRLYEFVKKSRSPSDAIIQMHSYKKDLRLGHKHICRAPDAARVLSTFVDSNK